MNARERGSVRFEFCGLQIDSTLQFSELRGSSSDLPADLSVYAVSPRGLGAIPRGIPGAVTATIVDGDLAMRVPRAGGLWVRPGRIEVAASNSRWRSRLRPYVLGTGMAAAMYQLGIVPFHVSAVAVRGAAVAFTGESGAGKSTFAFAWQRRYGAEMLNDDIARIECDKGGVAMVYPGLLRVKLWRDSLNAFEVSSKSLVRDVFRAEKYLVSPDLLAASACPLKALVILELNPHVRKSRIQQVFGAQRLPSWIASAYRADLGSALGARAKLMGTACALAGAVPLYRLERARSFSEMNDDADLVFEQLRRDGCLPG